MKHFIQMDQRVESQEPSVSLPSEMSDEEFAGWSDRVTKGLVSNLNRNVLEERQRDLEAALRSR